MFPFKLCLYDQDLLGKESMGAWTIGGKGRPPATLPAHSLKGVHWSGELEWGANSLLTSTYRQPFPSKIKGGGIAAYTPLITLRNHIGSSRTTASLIAQTSRL